MTSEPAEFMACQGCPPVATEVQEPMEVGPGEPAEAGAPAAAAGAPAAEAGAEAAGPVVGATDCQLANESIGDGILQWHENCTSG